MNTNSPSLGRRSFLLPGPPTTWIASSPSPPSTPTTSALHSTVTFALRASWSTRYCDMLSAREAPRTSIVTDSA